MAARLLFIFTLLFLAGCGGGANILPEPFTRERADGKIPVKTELIRAQVRAELAGMPEGEAEVARWQAIESDYHSCRLVAKDKKTKAEEVFADCMAQRSYVYMYPIDAEQFHNDIAFEMEKERDQRIAAQRKAEEERIAAEKKRQEEQEQARRQKALNDALIAAVRSGDSKEEARLIAEGADPQIAERQHKLIAFERKAKEERIAATRKAEEERIAAENKRQKEQERICQQKALNEALRLNVKSRQGRMSSIQLLNNDGSKCGDAYKIDGSIDTIKHLIDSGANINAKYSDGSTPLHWPLLSNNPSIVSFLIGEGADVNAKTNSGKTPLHFIFSPWHIPAALALINAGADIDAKDNDGKTPLHNKAESGNIEIVRAFINAGAYVNTKDKNGQTPLHDAVLDDETETMLALIKHGADINAKDNEDWTPLHYAAGRRLTENLLVLIKHGAHIDAKNNDGWTPLHFAARINDTKTLLALIKHGADIDAKQNEGATPLHYAAWYGHTETLHALVKAGASLFIRTDEGATALGIAIQEHGKDSVIALFLQKAMSKTDTINEQKANKLLRELE